MPLAVAVVLALHAPPGGAPTKPVAAKTAIAAVAAAKPAPKKPSRAASIEEVVRAAFARGDAKLPRGASLDGVRATTLAEAPSSFSRAAVDVTPPPRKAGPVSAIALVTFYRGDDVVARVPVSLDLRVAADAVVFDVAKGTGITLVVERGLVEVSAPAVLSQGGDVGDVVQVLLRPSGRALRARLVAKDRAIAVEDGAR